jgi:hypothetical protein
VAGAVMIVVMKNRDSELDAEGDQRQPDHCQAASRYPHERLFALFSGRMSTLVTGACLSTAGGYSNDGRRMGSFQDFLQVITTVL